MTFEPVEIMTENEREGGREEVEEKKGREREELTYSVILHSPYQVI